MKKLTSIARYLQLPLSNRRVSKTINAYCELLIKLVAVISIPTVTTVEYNNHGLFMKKGR